MLQNTKAESFVGIIVGVFILSFVMLGIINILIFSNDMTSQYDEVNRILVLEKNITNIVAEIDTSNIQENEVFYLHKNPLTNTYDIHTGASNNNYQYIDQLGNNISDINTYQGEIYSQILRVANEDTNFLQGNQVVTVSVQKITK